MLNRILKYCGIALLAGLVGWGIYWFFGRKNAGESATIASVIAKKSVSSADRAVKKQEVVTIAASELVKNKKDIATKKQVLFLKARKVYSDFITDSIGKTKLVIYNKAIDSLVVTKDLVITAQDSALSKQIVLSSLKDISAAQRDTLVTAQAEIIANYRKKEKRNKLIFGGSVVGLISVLVIALLAK